MNGGGEIWGFFSSVAVLFKFATAILYETHDHTYTVISYRICILFNI